MRCLLPQLPWLLLVLACGPRTQGTHGSQAPPSREETKTLLTAIDAAFNGRELEALCECFRPSHKTLHAELKARMKKVMAYDARLQRESAIVKFDQRHGRAIALVRSRTRCLRRANLRHHVEHSYLVARTTPDGARAELMVPVEHSALPSVQEEPFSCPACNYSFGCSRRWVAVPAQPDQTGCMESLTFLALGHDLVAEVSVHVLPEALPADKALIELLEHMRTLPWLEIPARIQVCPWLPPAYTRSDPPCHLDGARFRVALRDGDSAFADIHLATFGPINYLMVVQGEEALLQDKAAMIDELLKGFRLLDTEKAPSEICQLALATHGGGGCVTGNHYKDPVHDLQLTAPAGWRGAAYASSHLFHVRFQCRGGAGSLAIRALAPPVGYTIWTEDKANELFTSTCTERELETPTDTAWTKCARGFLWRQVRSKDPQAPRILRLAIRGPVLVLMEGKARDEAVLEDIRRAMGTLAPLQR